MTEHQQLHTVSVDEVIIVEWPHARGGIEKAAAGSEAFKRMQEQSEKAINIAMGNIRSMARRVTKTMDQLEDKVRPNEVEVTFGINLDAEAGAFLAKASTGAQLAVNLKWSIE